MQISIEQTSALERRVNYGISKSEIDQKVQQKLNEVRKTMRLKGFRPGKVPVQVVKQRYGQQIHAEVMQDFMRSGLDQAISENELQVAALTNMQPDEAAKDDDNVMFVAELEVFPELGEFDLSDVKLDKFDVEIGASDIDEMLSTLREQRREWLPVEGEIAAEHRVLVEYVAQLGEQRVPAEDKLHLATIVDAGVLFAAFDNALVGMKVGSEKTVELDFPSDFREAQLAGQSAKVEIVVQQVDEASLPELDDAFAEQFGIVEGGIEKLREEVASNLEREKASAQRKIQKDQVGAELAKRFADLDLPESLVKQDAQSTQERMLQEVQQAGGDVTQVPQVETLLDSARQRVRGSIILNDIARQKSIELEHERVQKALMEIASTYDQPEQVIDVYRQNEQLLAQLQQTVLEDQVVEWVVDQADTVDQKMTFQDLMKKARGGE